VTESREPAEIVQAAALEAIKAVRAFLDIAESIVREPGTAAVVGKAFADAAAAAFRPTTLGDDAGTENDGDTVTETHQGVRRIHLND
jgi:hypothetical protein